MWAMYCRTLLWGKKVGTDAAGNRYYHQPAPLKSGKRFLTPFFRKYFLPAQRTSCFHPSPFQEKRWVLYAKSPWGAPLPPQWESWLRGACRPSPLTATHLSSCPDHGHLGSCVPPLPLPGVPWAPVSDSVWTPPPSNVKYQGSPSRDLP